MGRCCYFKLNPAGCKVAVGVDAERYPAVVGHECIEFVEQSQVGQIVTECFVNPPLWYVNWG